MPSSIAAFAAERVASRDFNRESDFPHDLWRAMAAAGYFRIGLPARFGGDGGGIADIAATETALIEHGGSPGFAMSWTGHQLVARFFIEGFGSAAQQAALMPALAEGRSTAAVAISEPGAGAHPKHLKTRAEPDGDGFRLNGEKAYVTNGPIADLFVVLAITAVEGDRKRYSAFLVPRDTPGLALTEGPKIDFLRPSPHCGLLLRDCRVPRASLLGEEGRAYETMAEPFRDFEDTAGTAGTLGSFRFALRQLGTASTATPEAAAALGELAALTALIAEASAAAIAALAEGRHRAGNTPATLVGIRTLTAHMLNRIASYREAFATASRDNLDPLLRDLDKSLAIAKGPRLVKQSRIGMDLFEKKRS